MNTVPLIMYLALLCLMVYAGLQLWQNRKVKSALQADYDEFWRTMRAKRFTLADRKEIAREVKEDSPEKNRQQRRLHARDEVKYLKKRALIETTVRGKG